jgi:hypothetical protein
METKMFTLGANGLEPAQDAKLQDRQIIYFFGQGMNRSRFAVFERSRRDGNRLLYHLVGLDDPVIRKENAYHCWPLSKKIGIGYYYNDEAVELAEPGEIEAAIRAAREAEEKYKKAVEKQQAVDLERAERGKVLLRDNMPAGAIGMIVAELREDMSDPMTDYFGVQTVKRVLLAWTFKERNDFSEMRKACAGCDIEDIFILSRPDSKEHREKYSGGSGYYLGDKYSGYMIRKATSTPEKIISCFAQDAGTEGCFYAFKPEKVVKDETEPSGEGLQIVDYSEKAIAVIGDTKPVKDTLKGLGGRFNFRLSCGAGWIFPKTREADVRQQLNIQ